MPQCKTSYELLTENKWTLDVLSAQSTSHSAKRKHFMQIRQNTFGVNLSARIYHNTLFKRLRKELKVEL